MSFIAILSALLTILTKMPELVKDVEDLIAAFKGGGPAAANTLLASKAASDTAALEAELLTPIAPASYLPPSRL